MFSRRCGRVLVGLTLGATVATVGAAVPANAAVNPNPVARLTVHASSIPVGSQVVVDTYRSTVPKGVKRLSISYGDGAKVYGTQLKLKKGHVYKRAGIFTVTLIIIDKKNHVSRSVKKLVVKARVVAPVPPVTPPVAPPVAPPVTPPVTTPPVVTPPAVTSGTAHAWGGNYEGELGDGNGNSNGNGTQVPVAGLPAPVLALAGGNQNGYALLTNGNVWAWGNNDHGQLGNGSATPTTSSTPVQVIGLSQVSAIAAGGGNGFALKSDGSVWGWGLTVAAGGTSTPVQINTLPGAATAIAAGNGTAYALVGGTVYSWGYNNVGQLGDGTVNSTGTWVTTNLSGVSAIAAGNATGYALKAGAVYSWGANDFGQLGDTTTNTTANATPTAVPGLSSGVTAIAAGSSSGYALAGGVVYAWGANGSGQLGNTATSANNPTPAVVSGLSGVTAIAGGNFVGYALKSDKTVASWGKNDQGQLGNGAIGGPNATAGAVSGLSGVIAISSGGENGYAITSP